MKQRIKNILLTFYFVIYLILALMGAFEYIPPHNYELHQNNFEQYLPPSSKHIFGTDYYKKDIFTEFVFGATSTFYAGIMSIIPFALLGTFFGVASAYKNNLLQRVCNKILEIFNAIPKLIILLLFIGLFGNNILWLMIIFGLFSSPKLAELIRNKILTLKREDFIEASQAVGLSHFQIIFKHILWYNCRLLILSQMIFIYASSVFIEASLSYVNLGFSQKFASWGYMLYEARRASMRTVFTFPWESNFHIKAALVIFSITSLTLFLFYVSKNLKKMSY